MVAIELLGYVNSVLNFAYRQGHGADEDTRPGDENGQLARRL